MLLLVLLYGALHLSIVQNFLIHKVANVLSDELKTKVEVKHIDFDFFNKMNIEGVLVEDQKKDTLLYAGSIGVSITDWFFLKDKPVIHYARLSHVLVNFRRSDSTWNYAFLEDYFASDTPKKTNKKSGGIELDIKQVELTDIKFNQIDEWIGQDQLISLGKLSLSADSIDFDKKKIQIKDLLIASPQFTQKDYTGNREKLGIIKKKKKHTISTDPYQWNNDGWIIKAQTVSVINGQLQIERETERAPYTDEFDSEHFIFSKIDGNFKDLLFEKDTLRSTIQLATKEKSGFTVNKLKAELKFTPNEMEFKYLDIITPNSHLRNYYVMRYNEFENDMSSFLHKVELEGNFKNSVVSSDDIAFFAPELRSWKRKINLDGHAKGTVDNLSVDKMEVTSNNTYIKGKIKLIGLPDIDETFIDFKSDNLNTNFNEITSIIPPLKNIKEIQLSKLGNINFKGTYTGFFKDFVAFGTLNTDLGSVTTDINLKIPDKSPIEYSGSLQTDAFNLGKLISVKQLGKISLRTKIKGRGVSTNDINTVINGDIKNVEFNNYNFQNISLNGDFKKKVFNGTINVNDPNLVVENFNGIIDFTNKVPLFKVDANLAKLNTQKIKLTSDDYDISGKFKVNFSGNNIDNFIGSAQVYQAAINHNNRPLSFDSLTITSSITDNKKNLSISSNEAECNINGQFNIMELPSAFQLFLNKYYPAYIPTPDKKLTNQNFDFSIRTKNIDEYVKLADKKLSGFNNSIIDGKINLKNNELIIDANVPYFGYDKNQFSNINLHGKGSLDSLVATVDAEDIIVNDSLHFPRSNLKLLSRNDTSNISINTSATQTLGEASLNAMVQTMKGGVKIHFFPSSLIINDKKWEIEKDGELTLAENQMSANELKLVQGNQQITISTHPSELFNSNDIIIDLKKINLEDVTPFLFKYPHLEGLVSGKAIIENPFSKPMVEYNITANEFKIDKDSIGTVDLNGSYSDVTGIVKFEGGANGSENNFSVNGTYDINDSTDQQANINFSTKRFDLDILNNYLDGIFDNIDGIVNTDDLKISGNHKNLQLTGKAKIRAGALTVKYTQCRYFFTDETIEFKPDAIELGEIKLRDSLKNTGTLSGNIHHKFFTDFSFDKIKFESPKLLVLNTTKRDNGQFYGNVIGKAKMTLNGPVENMLMDIEGQPSETDSSHIYIQSGNSIENDEIDYINFVQFGKEMDKFYTKTGTNIVVNMNLKATPSCKIDVILDEITGDIIKGEGTGQLNIRVGNKEPLSIRGRYDISKGEYTFNFQTFLKKPFTLTKGNIVWTGDPYLANIDIIAEYLAKNVDFSNISSEIRKKSDVRIVSHLTETLMKPDIDFVFQLPDNSDLKNDFIISKKLQEITADQNEMNKQVTSLLLFNSFLNSNQSFLSYESGYSVLSNTIGGVMSGILSSSFNKILQKILNDNTVSFNVDLNSNLDLQSNVARLQGAAKASITKSFFKNRLIVTVGGNFDYNNPYLLNNTSGKNNNVLITPDVTAEWYLTKDGRVRLVGFNQTNIDIIGQRNKTGVKLTYRKDVDKLAYIFFNPTKK